MNKKSRKILIVDDDPGVVRLVSEILRGQGFETIEARDGLDAMVMVKQHAPDLVVLDIMMPELNGYDVCRNIKFDPKFENLPIIILTSRQQELDPRIGTMMNIDYIQKPLDRDVLLNKIRRALP